MDSDPGIAHKHSPNGEVARAPDAITVSPVTVPSGRKVVYQIDVTVDVEKSLLLIVGTLGVICSTVFIVILGYRRTHRSLSNAFLYHSGLLDAVKGVYSVLFAISIRQTRSTMNHQGTVKHEVVRHMEEANRTSWLTPVNAYEVTHICTLLGTTHTVLITIFIFNILAILCTEAFAFTDDNQQALISTETPVETSHRSVCGSRVTLNGHADMSVSQTMMLHSARGINSCCVFFTVGMIYVGSLVLHLGPTIIAGQFDMDVSQDIFHCNLVGGEVRDYITYSMWLAIICLALSSAIYYAILFHRMILANSTHRTVNILRAGVLLATSNKQYDENIEQHVLRILSLYKNRSRVLIALIALTVLCYCPLFFTILCSIRFSPQPFLYKVFRLVAFANPIFNAVLFLTFDRQLKCSDKTPSRHSPAHRTNCNRWHPASRVPYAEVSQSAPLVLQNDTALSLRERFELYDSTPMHMRIGQRLRNASSTPSRSRENCSMSITNDDARLSHVNRAMEGSSPIRLSSKDVRHPPTSVLHDI